MLKKVEVVVPVSSLNSSVVFNAIRFEAKEGCELTVFNTDADSLVVNEVETIKDKESEKVRTTAIAVFNRKGWQYWKKID